MVIAGPVRFNEFMTVINYVPKIWTAVSEAYIDFRVCCSSFERDDVFTDCSASVKPVTLEPPSWRR